jgi:hypothetical protein
MACTMAVDLGAYQVALTVYIPPTHSQYVEPVVKLALAVPVAETGTESVKSGVP